MQKLVAPDPNADLLRFFGSAPTFEFYGLKPKEIPIKVFEFEMEQKLKLLAIEEAHRDQTGVVASVLEVDDTKMRETLRVNNLVLIPVSAPPNREVPFVWLQWLLANRDVTVTLDEMKVRLGYDAVNEFVTRLTPPSKAKAGGDAPKL